MFSIANEIAYKNKMINARQGEIFEDNTYPLGPSCWFNVVGETTDKQYVENQGKLLLRLFVKLYEHEGKLPQIYIITPFRRIKLNLQNLIRDLDNWMHLLNNTLIKPPAKHELSKWCSGRIGTVHTFQGRQENIVFFVLGVDNNSQGFANWVASKPNLLNVALTCAKNRFYVIGDKQLWARQNYFTQLAKDLPTKDLG